MIKYKMRKIKSNKKKKKKYKPEKYSILLVQVVIGLTEKG